MVLTLIQQGLGLRPREKRALCGKMQTLDVGLMLAGPTLYLTSDRPTSCLLHIHVVLTLAIIVCPTVEAGPK